MNKTKEEIDNEFLEKLNEIGTKEYNIPKRYEEMSDLIRNHYLDMMKDIFEMQKKTIEELVKENKQLKQELMEVAENT